MKLIKNKFNIPLQITHRTPSIEQWPPTWASAWGDDLYGLWAELSLKGVTQRLRWIESGSFLMGSPNSEPDRLNFEGPQHLVTLLRGFWLADTACTQALWLAIVGGKNPSHFKNDFQLPVEQVGWDDVSQDFLPKLQAMLPSDTQATLPTEIQWEYACRAGVGAPFSFGEHIHSNIVNYNGNYPYGNGFKCQYRGCTIPVKALPANSWGLYQMHGNVWEWCWDGVRKYTEKEIVDLTCAVVINDQRVLRGGSWLDGAQLARSAYRLQSDRDCRHEDFGFRFSLKCNLLR